MPPQGVAHNLILYLSTSGYMPATKAYKDRKVGRTGEKAKRPHKGIPLEKSLTVQQVADLITSERGNVSRVADAIGTTRGTVADYIARHPELQNVLAQARERLVDQLEEVAYEQAFDGRDSTLKIFLLKTQGKVRGYDQSESRDIAKDVAMAAFNYVLDKSTKDE